MKRTKRIISLLLAIIMCAGLFSCMPNLKKYVVGYADEKIKITDEIYEDGRFNAFLDKVNKLSLDFHQSISGTNAENNNLCLAPSAVYISLAVAAECSEGETRQEILDALGLTYDELLEFTKYYYALFNKEYTYTDNYGNEFVSAHETLATSIWMDSNLRLNSSCVASLNKNFNCDVFAIDFNDGTGSKVINQYIGYKMHNIVSGDINLSRDTDFSIVSLYHLKEIWNDLGRNITLSLETYDFTNHDKSAVQKQLLKSTYSMGRAYNAGKYTTFYVETEHGYKLHFIVPGARYSLDQVFNADNIMREINRTNHGAVDDTNQKVYYTRVLFPQTVVEFSGDITENLQKDFGITSLFDEKECDFSGLSYSEAWCNNFIHKSKVTIDAKGIEGSNINFGLLDKNEPDYPEYEKVYLDYIVDKAFGFVVVDAEGLILYVGELKSLE